MNVATLIERLAADDRAHSAAADELAALGEQAVAPLLAVLGDQRSPLRSQTATDVLQRLGDAAFVPLVDAIAAAPDERQAERYRWAFARLRVADRSVYTGVLDHPNRWVRRFAATAFGWMGADAEPFLPDLIGSLDDPDAQVRTAVIAAFEAVGAASVPVLRLVRRSGGRRRRAALTALAGIGGWQVLDDVDRRALSRLIEVKATSETPQPMDVCEPWFAIATTDQAAVLDAFELAGPRPVTMRLGESAWRFDQHDHRSLPHQHCRRMYVSPAFDGWTLVFGELPAVAHARGTDRFDALLTGTVRSRTAELSARFGAAHWFGADCGDGWAAWCLAERGKVVRFYDGRDYESQIGRRHPAEDGLLLPHEEPFPDDAYDGVPPGDTEAFLARHWLVKEQLGVPGCATSTRIAGRVAVDPSALGPHTAVTGRAVLARTVCGVAYGGPPGALAI